MFKITGIVKGILENHPTTRNSDYLLWLKVIENWAELNGCPMLTKTMTVETFLTKARGMLPNYSSVSRARRKLQRKYPELKAAPKVEVARAVLEQEYRDYAKASV